MKDKLTASEAIYGFCGWLSGQKKEIKMGTNNDCAVIAELVGEFCVANNLQEPRKGWTNNLIHPSGECSGPVT